MRFDRLLIEALRDLPGELPDDDLFGVGVDAFLEPGPCHPLYNDTNIIDLYMPPDMSSEGSLNVEFTMTPAAKRTDPNFPYYSIEVHKVWEPNKGVEVVANDLPLNIVKELERIVYHNYGQENCYIRYVGARDATQP